MNVHLRTTLSSIARSTLRSTSASAMGLLIWSLARTASAYNFPSSCWSPNHKDSGPLAETRRACTIPTGSVVHDAYESAIASWNDDSNLPVTTSQVTNQCSIDLSDWNNDVILVPRAQIDGNNGLTTFAHINACFSPPGPGNWGATDVRVADDLDFEKRNPSNLYSSGITAVGTGRATLIHEMGHQLGLGHYTDFNMMTITGLRPSSPLGPVPFPDDVAGVAALYGRKNFSNIFPSGQHWDAPTQTVINNHESAEDVCVGASFVANVTVVNPGSTDATYDQQLLLDDDANGSSPAVTFNWAGATTPLQNWSTFAFTISTEGLSPGRYFLLHKVDSGQQIAESREDDNVLLYTGPIQIVDCNNTLAAFASTTLYQ